jgi:hypothetical protein
MLDTRPLHLFHDLGHYRLRLVSGSGAHSTGALWRSAKTSLPLGRPLQRQLGQGLSQTTPSLRSVFTQASQYTLYLEP